jgi:hypothetical protein
VKFRICATAFCGIICSLFVSGCGTMLVKPAVGKVKAVAVVSVYMNREFYDIRSPRTSVKLENLRSLGQAVVKGTEIPGEIDDPASKEYEILINYAIRAYSDRLQGSGNWKWLEGASVLSNESYRQFAESLAGRRSGSRLIQVSSTLNEAEWFTARDMVRIPMESLTGGIKVINIGQDMDPLADIRVTLGKLCEKLNVDAVAILEFDMAFKRPPISINFLSDAPAAPSISSALVLVDRNGEVIVNSGVITKGQGKRFEGTNVGMLRQDYVHLDDKNMDSFRLAIDRSADDMKQRFSKALSKIK